MFIAADVYYTANRAKAVGVLFRNWSDTEPHDIVVAYTDNPLEYEPGNFYKRELPCIQALIAKINLDRLNAIIVDGYVYLNDDQKPGLGYYVYQCYNERIPVIGVAKSSFHDNNALSAEVYRGNSTRPLFITAAGMDLAEAAAHIQSMHGHYRFPYLLKLLDTHTKTNWEASSAE